MFYKNPSSAWGVKNEKKHTWKFTEALKEFYCLTFLSHEFSISNNVEGLRVGTIQFSDFPKELY